jgi:hypothetical protein
MLDWMLAAWGAVVILRFFAQYLGLREPLILIERNGLQVALLGLCLGLAAIDAALDACAAR